MALTKVSTEGIENLTIKDEDISNSAAINASKISGLATDKVNEGNTSVEVIDAQGNNDIGVIKADLGITSNAGQSITESNYFHSTKSGNDYTTEINQAHNGNNNTFKLSVGNTGGTGQFRIEKGSSGGDNAGVFQYATGSSGAGGQWSLSTGGQQNYLTTQTTNIFAKNVVPQTDSQIDLGSNTVRWQNVYADDYYGSGANLTNLPAAQLTGALPAIDGSNLTGVAAGGASNITFNSGNGIDFSATADGTGSSSRSELLDDYESGEWTGSINSGSANISNEWYVKVGKLVIGGGNISAISDTSSSNPIIVSGLPFTNSGGNSGSGAVSASKNNQFDKMIRCYVSGTDVRFITSSLSTGSNDYLRHSSVVQSSGSITFGFNYQTS